MQYHEAHGPSSVSDYLDRISDTTVTLAAAKIIPEFISKVTEEAELSILYNGRAIVNAKELSPSETQDEPEVVIKGQDTYTLLMVDPDAPSPDAPKYRYFLHWLVINIPGVDVQRGEVVTEYMGPSPPKGKHRYIFLLFKQHNRVKAKSPKSRQNFAIHSFMKDHNLSDPAAALFFYSSPE